MEPSKIIAVPFTVNKEGLTYRGNVCSFKMERESTLVSSSLPEADDGKPSAAWSIKSTNTGTISTVPTDSLTQLEVVGIITVLEDCVDQLGVLGLIGNNPQFEDKTTFKSLEERRGKWSLNSFGEKHRQYLEEERVLKEKDREGHYRGGQEIFPEAEI
uniref:Uncharacterized protein n=1 Tax=Timema bartmani TaxID=61472 RepID=A0A7R9I471_9NEOP|nr:unnamed protein product [Timema bartmani]